jgi:pyruvate carboxylase
VEAGVDVIDLALSSVSGLTSQPNFNSVVASLRHHPREQPLNLGKLNEYANYWEDVREFYYPFESGLKAGTAQVYEHEIPGGQYSNLRPQAVALGLEEKFEQIKSNYRQVNQLFGNIVKVTPSSKVVGDMALYLTSNSLTVDDVLNPERNLSFPDSVVDFFRGNLGQPYGGFPKKVQKIVLKEEKPFKDRPNKHLEPIDFEKGFENFQHKFPESLGSPDFLSHQLYPKVFEDYYAYKQVYGEVWYLPTLTFLYGLKQDEETLVQIDNGKSIIIKMLFVSEPDSDGMRTVSFELNGQTRRIKIRDNNFKATRPVHRKAETDNEVGAPLQGRIAKIQVKEGQRVKENDLLFVIEAMKMETSVTAVTAGKIRKIHLQPGVIVEQDDLIVEFE